jgi:hypothetical protein
MGPSPFCYGVKRQYYYCNCTACELLARIDTAARDARGTRSNNSTHTTLCYSSYVKKWWQKRPRTQHKNQQSTTTTSLLNLRYYIIIFSFIYDRPIKICTFWFLVFSRYTLQKLLGLTWGVLVSTVAHVKLLNMISHIFTTKCLLGTYHSVLKREFLQGISLFK